MKEINDREYALKIKKINAELRAKGFKYNEILNFHRRCVKDVVISDVYELTRQGYVDASIAHKVGIYRSMASNISTQYWNEVMANKHKTT